MKHAEHQIQAAIIEYLRLKKVLCFAIPNGEKREKRAAARLKKEGVLAGVADIMILLKMGICVFVEVKSSEGKQSPAQKEFEKQVQGLGYSYYVWRTLEDAIAWHKEATFIYQL